MAGSRTVRAVLAACAAATAAAGSGVKLREWRMCPNAADVPARAGHAAGGACLDVAVPTTILAAELAAGLHADPFVDRNLQQIKDISEAGGRDHYTRWFVIDDLNAKIDAAAAGVAAAAPHRHFLNFRGVQHAGEIHAYGNVLGDMLGMFRRGTFELPMDPAARAAPAGTPDLAVRVSPPTYFGANVSGQGGTHELARNGPTTQFAAGWDWIRNTPDRHTGIWDNVGLRTTGLAAIVGDVDVDSKVTRVRKSNRAVGDVSLNASVTIDVPKGHHVGDYTAVFEVRAQDGTAVLASSAATGTVTVTTVDAHSTTIRWSTALPNARLWYPHAYGAPHLHELSVRVVPRADAGGEAAPSDARVLNVGFRNVGFVADYDLLMGPVPVLNGERVFLTGGNWIVMDQFLRGTADKAEYRKHVRMHKEMGLDVIRVWGGGIAERPEFFEVCDEEGVLVWQEFWMTGDNNGRWAGKHAWPEDHALYIANVEDTMRLLKNHASLGYWCLGNELDGREGAEHAKDGALLDRMVALLNAKDPQRYVWRSSMGFPYSYDATKQAAAQDGNYGINSELEAWSHNPGMAKSVKEFPIPFNPEIGASAVPVYESLTEFLSADCGAELDACLDGFPKNSSENISDVWAWHMYEGWNDTDSEHWIYDRYNLSYVAGPSDAARAARGIVANADDFADYAQMAQYDQSRLLFEGHVGKMWVWYSGVFHWKSQSPWPAFRGFFYDWRFRQTGGYFGVKAALRRECCADVYAAANANASTTCWSLVHAMREPVAPKGSGTHNIVLANRNYEKVTIPRVCSIAYSAAGVELERRCVDNVDVDGMRTNADAFPGVVQDAAGTAVVRLYVWTTPATAAADKTSDAVLTNEYLTDMYRKGPMWRTRQVAADRPGLTIKSATRTADGMTISVTSASPNAIAAGVYVTVVDADGGPVLPVYCDVGYFNVVGSETRDVVCTFDSAAAGLTAFVQGFNTEAVAAAL